MFRGDLKCSRGGGFLRRPWCSWFSWGGYGFPVISGLRRSRFAEARRLFHRQRERLEAKFVQLGTATNRRDSPRWIDCEFEDDVAYAWNRSTGELNAFVAVTIELEENGDRPAEIADLVSNLRRRRPSSVSSESAGKRGTGDLQPEPHPGDSVLSSRPGTPGSRSVRERLSVKDLAHGQAGTGQQVAAAEDF